MVILENYNCYIQFKWLKKKQRNWTRKMCDNLKNPTYDQKVCILEQNIKQVTGSTYFTAKPKVMFTSNPLLTHNGKNLISKFGKSMVVYLFKCYYDNSYIGLTS